MLKVNNKSFGVLGLGKSGTATVEFLNKIGARLIAWDDNEQCRNSAARISDSIEEWSQLDYVVLSPGVPFFPHPHPLAKLALDKGVKIICDLELFYLTHPNNKYIGVTGTNGKSTTVALIHHILTDNAVKARLVGNIGTPILSVDPEPNEVIVVEASSYQLDLIDKFKFDVAVLLNITEDHLDRHGSFENYTKAKLNIFKNCDSSSTAVIAIDNEISKKIAHDLESINFRVLKVSTNDSPRDVLCITENTIHDSNEGESFGLEQNKSLRGQHNAENIIASYAATKSLGIKPRAIASAINTFVGLKHRAQFVGMCDGVEFINDSKATNAEATEKAFEIFNNIYWIVGGLPKTGGIETLHGVFYKVKHAFLVGKAADEFAVTLSKHKVPYTMCGTLEKAFFHALEKAKEDKSVSLKTLLLAPACASWDQWKNFEERGDYFIDLVNTYLRSHK